MLKLFYLFLFVLSCIPVHKPSMKNPFDGILGYFYGTFPDKDAGNRISSFSFLLEKNPILFSNVSGVISGNDISVTIPVGIDITKLAASFVTTGKRITVNGLAQESGVTINDFTNPVVYSAYADSGAQRDYKVTVKSEIDRNKVITLFAFTASNNPLLPSDIIGVINGNRISVSLPKNTALSSLIAVFMTNGVKVEVNGVAQASGTTINNFTNPVVYKVYDLDGGSQDYQVKATVGSPQINVKVGTTSYASESTYDFGTQYFGLTGTPVTFTIENTGTGDLALTGGARVVLEGEADANFTYTQPKADVIKAGGSTTFTVTFKPVVNKKTLKIVIANDSVATPNYAVNVASHPSGFIKVNGEMATGRIEHSMIKLSDNKIFIAGGSGMSNDCEIYDSVLQTFTYYTSCFTDDVGYYPSIIDLDNGTIFIFGGLLTRNQKINIFSLNTYTSIFKTLLYSHDSGEFSNMRKDKAIRFGNDILLIGINSEILNIQSQSLLSTVNNLTITPNNALKINDSSILIIGSDDRVELYDTNTKMFSILSNRLNTIMSRTTQMILLQNDKVLIFGNSSGTKTAEVYNIANRTFQYTINNLNYMRRGSGAILLNNNKVLITGGDGDTLSFQSGELYDPDSNSFSLLPIKMIEKRYLHSAVLLHDGTVLITGGVSTTGVINTAAELFVP